MQSLPGVEAVSLAELLPLDLASARRGITVEGYDRRPGEDMEVHSTLVAPGYFEAMRIPVLRGRGFSKQDRRGSPGVVIVNESFARRYWPGQDPLGKRIQMGTRGNEGDPFLDVVGVAKDGKYSTLGEDPTPFFYLPILQNYSSNATLVVRTTGNPLDALPGVRREIDSLDPRLPVHDAKTMTQHLGLALFPARLAGTLLGGLGFVALLLAAIGIYGVVAYWVAQRTREIGIRMALGAQWRDVVQLVLGRGMSLTLMGLAIGFAGAFAVTRFLRFLLYGVGATDPLTFGGSALLLGAVAAVASYLPARRATKVDPLVALRWE